MKQVIVELRVHVLGRRFRFGEPAQRPDEKTAPQGASHRTINANMVAVRSFCRWLIERKRMVSDPTAGLKRLNEDEDRRRTRRALTDKEAELLIESTLQSEWVYRRLSGEDRAILYMTAQRTGLRRSELRRLTTRSFQLTEIPATVTIEASSAKGRKKDVLPLPTELATILGEYLAGRESDSLVWPGSWWRRSAEMTRHDLEEAGIEAMDSEGRVLDFHGHRMTFITGLARAGVTPAKAQKLARHSDVNLTMKSYTQLQASDLADAVNKLPELRSGSKRPESVPGRATRQVDLGGGFPEEPELQRVVEAWFELSLGVRKAILNLVESGKEVDT